LQILAIFKVHTVIQLHRQSKSAVHSAGLTTSCFQSCSASHAAINTSLWSICFPLRNQLWVFIHRDHDQILLQQWQTNPGSLEIAAECSRHRRDQAQARVRSGEDRCVPILAEILGIASTDWAWNSRQTSKSCPIYFGPVRG
jgi:hypothetical protein